MRMLDLGAGLGGASEAFLQAGWDVVRIDNNPALEDVPEMKIIDILEGGNHIVNGHFDFIWASPDCTDFSLAYNAPGPMARREGKPFTPDTQLVEKMKAIIDYYNPEYWVIENVRGASKIFSRLLQSPPRQIVGPYYFWGLFPFIDVNNYVHGREKMNTAPGPMRYNERSKIPLQISEAFHNAITGQRKITEWII
jgi:hypothetical protein